MEYLIESKINILQLVVLESKLKIELKIEGKFFK